MLVNRLRCQVRLLFDSFLLAIEVEKDLEKKTLLQITFDIYIRNADKFDDDLCENRQQNLPALILTFFFISRLIEKTKRKKEFLNVLKN